MQSKIPQASPSIRTNGFQYPIMWKKTKRNAKGKCGSKLKITLYADTLLPQDINSSALCPRVIIKTSANPLPRWSLGGGPCAYEQSRPIPTPPHLFSADWSFWPGINQCHHLPPTVLPFYSLTRGGLKKAKLQRVLESGRTLEEAILLFYVTRG